MYVKRSEPNGIERISTNSTLHNVLEAKKQATATKACRGKYHSSTFHALDYYLLWRHMPLYSSYRFNTP